MRKLVLLLFLLLLAGAVAFRLAVASITSTRDTPAAFEAQQKTSVEEAPAKRRGRPPQPPNAEVLARARAHLIGGYRDTCGPYLLFTDVVEKRPLAACALLATELDEIYERRYGLRPEGEPAEAIVIFSDPSAFRAFARESGVPAGYAGYAIAARGLAVFHYDRDQPFESFLTTLSHELTHLVHRRALGVNLPPWLSEGLADGIGDTATAEGHRSLLGVVGSEVQARRLRQAYRSGYPGSLERLAELERGDFDRAAVSFDYEASALFVRFLLSEPELATAFRTFLEAMARSEVRYSSEALASALGASWEELDRRFETWLQKTGSPRTGRLIRPRRPLAISLPLGNGPATFASGRPIQERRTKP